MTILYHATSTDKIAGIAQRGLDRRSYWTDDEDLSNYYVETIRDEKKTPIILAVDLDDLYGSLLKPDLPGIAEPITTVLGKDEDDISEEWDASDQDWQSSLDIIKSVMYAGAIPIRLLRVIDANDESHMFSDYVAQHMPEVVLPDPDYDQFIQNVQDFLGSSNDAIYEVIGEVTGCGPFDGGCLLFAQALQKAKGGEIYALVSQNGAEHAILYVDGIFYDAGGPGNYASMVDRICESEGRDLHILHARPMVGEDFRCSLTNPAAVEQIAGLLQHVPVQSRASEEEETQKILNVMGVN